jgi:hypothetical protein
VPRMLLDLEQVLEGIEGALADPVSLGNDPTMYAPEQERPSSAVAAQLRPLLSVARTRVGADMAENPLDFAHINKLHNKFRKATHETRDNFFGDDNTAAHHEPDPRNAPGREPDRQNAPDSHLSAVKPSDQSPSASPTAAQRRASWKVEMPHPSPLPKPAPVPSPLPPAPQYRVESTRELQAPQYRGGSVRELQMEQQRTINVGSKREEAEQQKLMRQQLLKAQSSWRQQGLDPLAEDNQFTQDQRNQEFMRQRASFMEQSSRPKPSESAFGVSRQSNYASSAAMKSAKGGFGRAPSAEASGAAPFDPMSAKAAMHAGALYHR